MFDHRPFVSIVAGAIAVAAQSLPAEADDLSALLVKRRCVVAAQLRAIHALPDPSDEQDRFLILSRVDAPQDYVQCHFADADRAMRCEAASGYFFDVPRTMHLPPPAIAALGHLGFSTDDAAPQNFTQTFSLAAEPDLDAVATLMLTALHVGYGVTAATRLDYSAPNAKALPRGCTPVG